MNFYFTGTGNSLYVAKQLDQGNYSIPQVLRQNDLSFTAESIGIVCPIYGHEMPKMVKKFIKEAVFHTNYFYLILTYGARHGGATEIARKYFERNGQKLDYSSTLLMVDNFLPAFDMTQQLTLNKKVDEQIVAIKSDLDTKKYALKKTTKKDELAHESYLSMVNHAPETIWANYIITDDCIGCGICTRVCPGGCIHLDGQRAIHTNNNCQACYACIQACPKMAIRFGDIPLTEPNPNARYRNAHISLNELVQANDQTTI